MAWETGTATDYMDLLSKLKTFATTNVDLVAASQQWTILGDATAPGEVLTMQGPGLAASDQIIVTVAPYESTANDYYNWRLGGCIGYDPTPVETWFGASPSADKLGPRITLANSSMQYWFRGDGRSLSGVVKVSSSYESFTLGLMLPFATPGQWPLPLVVGGTTTTDALRFSDTSNAHSVFWNPTRDGTEGSENSPLVMRDAAGNWIDFANYATVALTESRFVFPRRYSTTGRLLTKWLEPVGSCYPTDRLELTMRSPSLNRLGVIDGWLWTTGYSLFAEDIVQIGGVDHLAIPNVFRSGLDQWALMELA